MDRIRQMEAFIQIIESGNFTRASEVMGVPRSTISTEIQKLEDRLGTQLLHRTTRTVTPTQDGLQFLDRAREIVDAMDDAETAFRRSPRQITGRLRVDMPSRFGSKLVIPALASFLEAHPNVSLDISTTDRPVDLVTEGIDVIIRVGETGDSSVIGRKLGELRLINCASPDYLPRFGVPQSPSDLQQHMLVNFSPVLPASDAVFEWERGEAQMESRIAVDNADAYIAAAIAGHGIIQVPAYDVEPELAAGQLIEILPEYTPEALSLTALFARKRNLSFRIEVFILWLGALIAERSIGAARQVG
jgi:DNA-binding transcriptional LysR family regulator